MVAGGVRLWVFVSGGDVGFGGALKLGWCLFGPWLSGSERVRLAGSGEGGELPDAGECVDARVSPGVRAWDP